jgi:hypothetical protein
MSTLTTTQTIPGTSGIRNSGGIVNIAGPVIVKDIYAIALSGNIASASGVRLSVNVGTSGAFSGAGPLLFYADLTGQSGLAPGNVTFVPPWVLVEQLALSGVVTVNSGTHLYDLIVTYKSPA